MPSLSHATPREHRSPTRQKPHDFNVSKSTPEIPSRELHAIFPVPDTGAPAKGAYLSPKHRPRGTSTTTQHPFRQSADPLSKNSQISWNFGEWVYGLAKATAWNHYAHTHKPTQPASSNS